MSRISAKVHHTLGLQHHMEDISNTAELAVWQLFYPYLERSFSAHLIDVFQRLRREDQYQFVKTKLAHLSEDWMQENTDNLTGKNSHKNK